MVTCNDVTATIYKIVFRDDEQVVGWTYAMTEDLAELITNAMIEKGWEADYFKIDF